VKRTSYETLHYAVFSRLPPVSASQDQIFSYSQHPVIILSQSVFLLVWQTKNHEQRIFIFFVWRYILIYTAMKVRLWGVLIYPEQLHVDRRDGRSVRNRERPGLRQSLLPPVKRTATYFVLFIVTLHHKHKTLRMQQDVFICLLVHLICL
jgi:hypothetical protein